ncbi:hypothetical protein BSKO_06164 [Bryopsis sp. KO-2023]|nr:hypothetical protein BSKO_06164 [Bryopsis sp. KO-2023]
MASHEMSQETLRERLPRSTERLDGGTSGTVVEEVSATSTDDVTIAQPFCVGFKNTDMEASYLRSVACWRRPVLAAVMCFDIFCFFVRIGWHLIQYVYLDGTLQRVNEISRQLWNLGFVYILVGMVNWRTKRLRSRAPGQEEILLSIVMALAISNLLISLEGEQQDYVVACMFLVSATTILKIRWWVGSIFMSITVVTAFVLDKVYHRLPSEALAHILLGWMCGMMVAYQSDYLRREMFASQQRATIAHKKEMEEAQARIQAQRDLAAAQILAAENSLQMAQEVSANEAKSEFMRVMCHEIRTPLNGCLASAEMLLDTALQDEQRELACIIRVCGRILLSTVSNFLDFFKLEAGGDLDLVETEVDLPKLMTEVQGIIQAMVGSGNRDIEIREPLLSNAPKVILGDADRLRGIVLNLYSNAAKFTHQGFIHMSAEVTDVDVAPDPGPQYDSVTLPPQIRSVDAPQQSLKQKFMSNRPSMASLANETFAPLTQDTKKQWLLFQVRDSGVGISAAGMKSLFKEYAQGSAEEMRKPRTNAGTGLGLSICLKQVGALGGRIGAYSCLGTGSVFWFTVPLKRVESSTATRRTMSLQELKESSLALSPLPTSAALCMERAWLGGVKIGKDGISGQASVPSTKSTNGSNSSQESTLQGCRVLLVEDNLMNQVVAQKMLQSLGVQCTIASNGVEAVEEFSLGERSSDSGDENKTFANANVDGANIQLEREVEMSVHEEEEGVELGERQRGEGGGGKSFDVILMDILMPKMGGIEATKVLRSGGVSVPIIALTANALESDCERCRQVEMEAAGMDGFLSKPVLKGDLKECLLNVIRGDGFHKDKNV